MKTLPDHRATHVDSLSDLGLFNLPRVAGRTLVSMAGVVLGKSARSNIQFWTVSDISPDKKIHLPIYYCQLLASQDNSRIMLTNILIFHINNL